MHEQLRRAEELRETVDLPVVTGSEVVEMRGRPPLIPAADEFAPARSAGAPGGTRSVRSYESLDGAEGRGVFFRPHRYTAADLEPLRGTIGVLHDGEVGECTLRDLSESGVAFDWPTEPA